MGTLTFSDFPPPSGASSGQIDKRSGSPATPDDIPQQIKANRMQAVPGMRCVSVYFIKNDGISSFNQVPHEGLPVTTMSVPFDSHFRNPAVEALSADRPESGSGCPATRCLRRPEKKKAPFPCPPIAQLPHPELRMIRNSPRLPGRPFTAVGLPTPAPLHVPSL